MIRLSYKVNTMVIDDLATQGARASTVMILTWLSSNVPVSALAGLNHPEETNKLNSQGRYGTRYSATFYVAEYSALDMSTQ